MASVAAPLARQGTFFDMPNRRHRQRSPSPSPSMSSSISPSISPLSPPISHLKAHKREAASQRTEQVSRARAAAYLGAFLTQSSWAESADQITVVWDEVPTMEELEHYGDLDETEGTRMCRRMFKAVVIWDELGHSLWERLRKTKEQKRDALKGLGPMLRMGTFGDASTGTTSTRSGSNDSGSSRESTPVSSPKPSIDVGQRIRASTLSTWNEPLQPVRSSTEPMRGPIGRESHRRRASENSKPAIPKMCVDAMRRRLGALTDSRSGTPKLRGSR